MAWSAMALLGAYHGINPGMGWLFAVALAMQRGSARGVWRALPPIALGHALAVGIVVLIADVGLLVLPLSAIKIVLGSALIVLGGYRFWRHRHPRFGGMQVGFRDLTAWSFLMASAHGAGFMVLPFVLGEPTAAEAAMIDGSRSHLAGMAAGASISDALAVGVHTATYLLVTAIAAWIVYRKIGLAFLRTAWLNTDWLWAGALVITGLVVFMT
jgi:hypothetical protein